jgi:hypothetical protein
MDRETSRWNDMEKQQDKAVERVAILQASKKGLKNQTRSLQSHCRVSNPRTHDAHAAVRRTRQDCSSV